jgi:hypothetical protein
MTKKRLILFAVLPVTIATVVGLLALLPPWPGVTKANFDRVQEKMTAAEIEEIFGRKGIVRMRGEIELRSWRGDDKSEVWVLLRSDRVTGKKWFDSPETLPDKLRRWLYVP